VWPLSSFVVAIGWLIIGYLVRIWVYSQVPGLKEDCAMRGYGAGAVVIFWPLFLALVLGCKAWFALDDARNPRKVQIPSELLPGKPEPPPCRFYKESSDVPTYVKDKPQVESRPQNVKPIP